MSTVERINLRQARDAFGGGGGRCEHAASVLATATMCQTEYDDSSTTPDGLQYNGLSSTPSTLAQRSGHASELRRAMTTAKSVKNPRAIAMTRTVPGAAVQWHGHSRHNVASRVSRARSNRTEHARAESVPPSHRSISIYLRSARSLALLFVHAVGRLTPPQLQSTTDYQSAGQFVPARSAGY